MKKRIITWRVEGKPVFRAFIFGGYGTGLRAYQSLIKEALADFPELQDEDIDLSRVSKSSYMDRFICVSFLVTEAHPGYELRDSFDFSW